MAEQTTDPLLDEISLQAGGALLPGGAEAIRAALPEHVRGLAALACRGRQTDATIAQAVSRAIAGPVGQRFRDADVEPGGSKVPGRAYCKSLESAGVIGAGQADKLFSALSPALSVISDPSAVPARVREFLAGAEGAKYRTGGPPAPDWATSKALGVVDGYFADIVPAGRRERAAAMLRRVWSGSGEGAGVAALARLLASPHGANELGIDPIGAGDARLNAKDTAQGVHVPGRPMPSAPEQPRDADGRFAVASPPSIAPL